MGEGLILWSDVPRLLQRVADRSLEASIASDEAVANQTVDSFVDTAVQVGWDKDIARSVADEYLEWRGREPPKAVDRIALLERKLWLAYDVFKEHWSMMTNTSTQVQCGKTTLTYSIGKGAGIQIQVDRYSPGYGMDAEELFLTFIEEIKRGIQPARTFMQVIKRCQTPPREPDVPVKIIRTKFTVWQPIQVYEGNLDDFIPQALQGHASALNKENLRLELNNLLPALRTIYAQNMQGEERF